MAHVPAGARRVRRRTHTPAPGGYAFLFISRTVDNGRVDSLDLEYESGQLGDLSRTDSRDRGSRVLSYRFLGSLLPLVQNHPHSLVVQ
jgi:hypothetical protein